MGCASAEFLVCSVLDYCCIKSIQYLLFCIAYDIAAVSVLLTGHDSIFVINNPYFGCGVYFYIFEQEFHSIATNKLSF